MSATLYALVILQGTTLTFEPGYPTAAECTQQYKGDTLVASRMTRTSARGRRSLNSRKVDLGQSARLSAKTSARDTSVRLRTVSRPPAGSWRCPSLVTLPALRPMPPPPPAPPPKPPEVTPPPVPPEPKPDPASLETKPNDVQVGGKSYAKVAGLTWVEREDSFADVSVGPNDLQSKDAPWPQRDCPTPLPPKVQTAQAPQGRYVPMQYAQHPEPLKAIIDVVMLPFDFLAYPGRRDW